MSRQIMVGECPERAKIQYKYAIGLAMRNSPRALKASEIYDFIKVYMPKICPYKNNNWENCIRGHVTRCKLFLKITTPKEGRDECTYTFQDEAGWTRQFSENYAAGDDFLTNPQLRLALYYGQMGFPNKDQIEKAKILFEKEREQWRQQLPKKTRKPKVAQPKKEEEEDGDDGNVDEQEQNPQLRNQVHLNFPIRGVAVASARFYPYDRKNSLAVRTSRQATASQAQFNINNFNAQQPGSSNMNKIVHQPMQHVNSAFNRAFGGFNLKRMTEPAGQFRQQAFEVRPPVPPHRRSSLPAVNVPVPHPTVPMTPAPVQMAPASAPMRPAPVSMGPAPVRMARAPINMAPAPVNMAPAPVRMAPGFQPAVPQHPQRSSRSGFIQNDVLSLLHRSQPMTHFQNPIIRQPMANLNNNGFMQPLMHLPYNVPQQPMPIANRPQPIPNGAQNPYELMNNHLNARPIKQEPSDPSELNNHGFVQPPVRDPHNPPQPDRPQPNTNGAQNPPNTYPLARNIKQEPDF